MGGQIVRMWKPWNGLQVYPIGGWNSTVEDESVFDVPPPQCKKGGAHIRITCDDDGHYMPKNKTEHVDFFDQMRALYAIRAEGSSCVRLRRSEQHGGITNISGLRLHPEWRNRGSRNSCFWA